MAKFDVVALSDAGRLATASLVGTKSPVSFGLSVTTAGGDPVKGLTKEKFGVTLIAPVTLFVVDTTAFLEVAEGIPPPPGGGAQVPPKEEFPGFYVLSVEPRSYWKEGDYVFGVTVERAHRDRTSRDVVVDRGQTLVKVHMA